MINPYRFEAPRWGRTVRQTQPIKRTTETALSGRITEVVLQDGDLDQIPLLLPLLAQISQAPRWLIWVAPPAMLPRELLTEAGIDLKKVILLKPDEQNDCYQLACKALAAGTAHAVISWEGFLEKGQIKGLEKTARQGGSHGIVIRRRLDA